jgi:GMP synthase (glutamine-hydrolysing)
VRLPSSATRLASNPWDPNQAVRFGPCTWGVQFHPEFDAEIVRKYVEYYREALSDEGQDPDHLVETVTEVAFGPELLSRFAQTALSESGH